MAEFVLMPKNNWMVDADKTGWDKVKIAKADRQYIKGDVVEILPDCKLQAASGKFHFISVSGLPYTNTLKEYHRIWNEDSEESITREISVAYWMIPVKKYDFLERNRFIGEPVIWKTVDERHTVIGKALVRHKVKKRRYRFKIEDLPLAQREQLESTFRLKITVEELEKYLLNKETNEVGLWLL